MRTVMSAGAAVAMSFLLLAPARAATPDELDRLFVALGTQNLFEIMRTEGLMQADELRSEMFPGRSSDGWLAAASAIYDLGTMQDLFRTRFDEELRDANVTPLLVFFEGSAGREIVDLELSARRALMDPDTEEAARGIVSTMDGENDPRLDLLEEFVDANDLVELNVMGALNASLSFYQGLATGDAFQLGEDQILRDVWAQEPAIRAETTEWMLPYLAMAYEPLSDDELQAYKALSMSEAGRDLNRALFAGFDTVFNRISYSLGSAASRFMQGDDI